MPAVASDMAHEFYISLVASAADLITAASTAGLFLVAAVTACVGFVTYRNQRAQQRARWILELARELADDPVFREVRSDLYRRDESRIAQLLAVKNSGHDAPRSLSQEDAELLVSLDDYLGFFELIDRLVAEGHMKAGEASSLFGWYLQQALDNPEVRRETCLYFISLVRLARLLALRMQASQALREANSQIHAASRAMAAGSLERHVPEHANSYIYRTVLKSAEGVVTASYFCECGDISCSAELRYSLPEYERERGNVDGIVLPGHSSNPD